MSGLDDLLVDKAELDQKLLAEVLLPLLGIDREAKEIVPKAPWVELGPDAKIVAYLLARKAMRAMPSVGLEIEGAGPKEIEDATGIKGGTLRPKLVAMKGRGLLAQDDRRRYFVATHAVLLAKEVIGEGNG